MPVDLPDRWLVALARRQHGVITTAQLAGVGIGRHGLAHRVRAGWLRRVHRGVYLVGPLVGEHSRAMAATLAAGTGALLSHYPAAVLRRFRPPCEGPMEVIVPGRERRSREGIVVHTAQLHPADATRHLGIPVTSAARTLLDIAATATTNELDRAVNEARVLHLVTEHSLNAQLSRYPTHRGTAALANAIRADPKLTRSEAEWRLLQLIRKARLPEPQTNVRIGSWEVDLLWRAERVVVEIDGFAFHSMRSSFERDRRKDWSGRRERRELDVHLDRVHECEAVVAVLAHAAPPRAAVGRRLLLGGAVPGGGAVARRPLLLDGQAVARAAVAPVGAVAAEQGHVDHPHSGDDGEPHENADDDPPQGATISGLLTIDDIDDALARARDLAARGSRAILGIAGPPGGGKSTLARLVTGALGDAAVLVPMDGFHLAQPELVRLGRRDRMGAPDTFDALGYVALLQRLRTAQATVYAPEFRREIEEPIAGAIAISPDTPLVVTEGNYLLLDDGAWTQTRSLLDEAWYVEMDEETRLEWLIARHVEFGKTPEEARAWVMRSDQANAEVVAASRDRADVVVRLGSW